MIVTVLQENLHALISRVSRVAPLRPQLTILQNVLLEAKDGELVGVGSSLDTTLSSRVGAKVQKAGSVCVPAKLFSELVASLPAGNVSLSLDKDGLRVTCGSARANVAVVNASEFPPVVEGVRKKVVAFESGAFVQSLRIVLFATSSDETRPLFSGVKMRSDIGKIQLVATDGYRLSLIAVPLHTAGEIDLVLPAKALSEVVKLVSEGKETKEVLVERTDNQQVVFTAGDSSILTRLVDGDYPGYQKIIPKAHSTRAVVDVPSLLKATKSAAIFARDNSNIVRMTISKDGCEMSANTPSVGESRVGFDADVEGDGGTIAFNCRFLLEFLSLYSFNKLAFQMTGSLNPGVFLNENDDTFMHIIMPVRVQG